MAPLFSKVDFNKLWHDVQNEETLICAKFGKDLFNISKVIGRKKSGPVFFDSQCIAYIPMRAQCKRRLTLLRFLLLYADSVREWMLNELCLCRTVAWSAVTDCSCYVISQRYTTVIAKRRPGLQFVR